jgi:hypothetical protein
MAVEKTARRMPLRDLITDAEKRTRNLAEHIRHTWISYAAELRDLSRTQRRKSAFPTYLALRHALEHLLEGDKETGNLIDHLTEELQLIREHAHRERLARR